MSFAERLKYLRTKKDLTQKDIANLLDVGITTISNYETGRNEPSYAKLTILAKYFNVTTDYLLGLTDDLTYINEVIAKGDIFEINFGDKCKRISKQSLLEVFIRWLFS